MPEELLTSKKLAEKLGISPRKVRDKLRKLYPRSGKEKGTHWKITGEWVKELEDVFKRPKRKLIAKVVSQKGKCAAGHKVGDEFDLSGLTPAGMCPFAFYVLFPFYSVIQYRGRFPWMTANVESTTVICPDPDNPVIFEIKKVPIQ